MVCFVEGVPISGVAVITKSPPIVIYQVAALGDWKDVVQEQLRTLARAGLWTIRVTHVGQGAEWLMDQCRLRGFDATLVRTDGNTDHYETFGIFEAERIAREVQPDQAILYMHTKGVSAPHVHSKRLWRRMMDYYIVEKWRENVATLDNHDAVGINWYPCDHDHFAGNYWIARPDWLRQLPDYARFHNQHRRVRFTCEWWIGSKKGCRANSLICQGEWWGNAEQEHLFSHRQPPPEAQVPTITWVSAATRGYERELARLQRSCELLGMGHQFVFRRLDAGVKWQHTLKFGLLRNVLLNCETNYVLWIDSDCEFVQPFTPYDIIDPIRPLVAVRHFGSTSPLFFLPNHLRSRVTWELPMFSWQACLFGGRIADLSDQLRRLEWMEKEGETYDEFGLVMDWSQRQREVHTLPCRFAAPTNFAPFPEYEETYSLRSGGHPIILHHNRNLNPA